MKFSKIKILCFGLAIVILIIPLSFKTFAVSGSIDLKVNIACDSDGVCDSGENSSNCSNDCGCNNNGSCESARGEDSSNCADCQVGRGGEVTSDQEAPTIYDVKIFNVGYTAASVSWKTTEDALCKLYLGKTAGYEMAVYSGTRYLTTHFNNSSFLTAATLYHFQVVCEDFVGNKGQTIDYVFLTSSLISNVADLAAQPQEKIIDLEWRSPKEKDFKEVVIVRSEKFYPQAPEDGTIIFQGKNEKFQDAGLISGKEYYYTVFSYDKFGNRSSGAIISATTLLPGEKPPVVKPPVGPVIEEPPIEVAKLKLEDFDFFQDGQKLAFKNGKLTLISASPLTISIDYEKVPEVLKTIMVSLEKDNKYFSFLLRINQDKTKYTATFAPPEPGIYPMSVYVLDYKNQTLKDIKTWLEIKGAMISEVVKKNGWLNKDLLLNVVDLIFPYIILALLAIIIILLLKGATRIFLKISKNKKEKSAVNTRC